MTTPIGPVINQPVSGLFTTSDFESKTHEELRAMVANAQPGKASHLSAKLATVADALGKMGDALKQRAQHVSWEGAGGDAFRLCVSDTANFTLHLGAYAKTASTWLGHAAETLSHVQSAMPQVSATDKTMLASYQQNHPGQVGSVPQPLLSDQNAGLQQQQGPTQQQAYAAQQRMEKDRLEAARLMRQLAESYAWSTHNMQEAPLPRLKPIDPRVMPPSYRRDFEYIPAPENAKRSVGGSSSASLSNPSGEGVSHVAAAPGVASTGHPGGSYTTARSSHESSMPSSHVRVDGVLAVPQTPSVLPAVEAPSRSDSISVPSQIPTPAPSRVPAMPPTGRDGTAIAKPVLGSRVPDARTVALPERGGGSGLVRPPGLAVPRDGVLGGRQVPRLPGQSQLPPMGGATVGGEAGSGRIPSAAQAGQMPAGQGVVPGVASGGPAGRAGAGTTTGRRLASEPGGVVGGQPRRRAGVNGEGPFTAGGTGLVRSAGERSSSPSRSGQRGQRPDYLVEDEDTWALGNRRVVPPVIG